MSDKEQNNTLNYQVSLEQWLDFSRGYYLKSHLIQDKLEVICQLSENKTMELTRKFQLLSSKAQEQSGRISDLTTLSRTVTIEDKEIELQEIAKTLQETFISSITCILDMSRQAVAMVYSLDDALTILSMVEKSIHEIEVINHKTKYLSLNATIEAVRAGSAGESFQVVASEVRELSNDTQNLATNIRGQVNQMSETLLNAQHNLQKVAKIDMTENIMAKEQLDAMIHSLVVNSHRMMEIMEEASSSNEEFASIARELVKGIQFQDRLQQDLRKIAAQLAETDRDIVHVGSDTCRLIDHDMNLYFTRPEKQQTPKDAGAGEGENQSAQGTSAPNAIQAAHTNTEVQDTLLQEETDDEQTGDVMLF